MKLDIYKKNWSQIKIGACFASTVHDLKKDPWYDIENEKGEKFEAENGGDKGYNCGFDDFKKFSPVEG